MLRCQITVGTFAQASYVFSFPLSLQFQLYGSLNGTRLYLAGKVTVAGRDYYQRQAATLLKYARSTSDPKIAAALLEMAAELSSQIDEAAAPDSSPRAPGVERPA